MRNFPLDVIFFFLFSSTLLFKYFKPVVITLIHPLDCKYLYTDNMLLFIFAWGMWKRTANKLDTSLHSSSDARY